MEKKYTNILKKIINYIFYICVSTQIYSLVGSLFSFLSSFFLQVFQLWIKNIYIDRQFVFMFSFSCSTHTHTHKSTLIYYVCACWNYCLAVFMTVYFCLQMINMNLSDIIQTSRFVLLHWQ
jgi:hypothetical protein